MSVIRVNQITNRTNSGGPIISGLTTVGVVTSGVSIGVTNLYVEQVNFGQTGILTGAVSVGTTDLYVSGTIFGNVTGNVTGDVTGNADTATSANNVVLGSETTDTQCFVGFTVDQTGTTDIRTNANLTFDSAAGTLVATAFSGTQLNASQVNASGVSTFTGNVDLNGGIDINGNTTGLNVTGVATFTDNVNLGDNDVLNIGAGNDLRLSHNSANSLIQNFTGGLYVTQHTDDSDIHLQTDDGSGGVTTYIQCVGSTGSVNLAHYGSTKLATTSGGVNITGVATATSFVGDLTGDVTGNADTATSATSATTATNATNITLADESSDTTCFPVFATSATGNQAPKTDSDRLTYNASSGLLVASTHQATSIIADSTLRVGSASTTSMDLYVVGNSASGVHNLGSKSSSFAIDMSTGNNYNFTIAGNITLNNPTNTQPGQSGVIMITQDGTGSRTLAYQSHWNFVDGTPPIITAGAGTTSVLAYHVQDTDMIITTSVLALG